MVYESLDGVLLIPALLVSLPRFVDIYTKPRRLANERIDSIHSTA
jgi:hypothetical protein